MNPLVLNIGARTMSGYVITSRKQPSGKITITFITIYDVGIPVGGAPYLCTAVGIPPYRHIIMYVIPRALISIQRVYVKKRVQDNSQLEHDLTPSNCIYLYLVYVDITRAPIWGPFFPFNAKYQKNTKWQPSFFKTSLASRKIYTYFCLNHLINMEAVL